jgi:hypothetical protein
MDKLEDIQLRVAQSQACNQRYHLSRTHFYQMESTTRSPKIGWLPLAASVAQFSNMISTSGNFSIEFSFSRFELG